MDFGGPDQAAAALDGMGLADVGGFVIGGGVGAHAVDAAGGVAEAEGVELLELRGQHGAGESLEDRFVKDGEVAWGWLGAGWRGVELWGGRERLIKLDGGEGFEQEAVEGGDGFGVRLRGADGEQEGFGAGELAELGGQGVSSEAGHL